MKRFLCLLGLVSAIFSLTPGAGAAQMVGADAQAQFAQWVAKEGGTHLDFEDLAAATLLDSQYGTLGVAFASIRDPDGTALSKPVAVVSFEGSKEIAGSPSWSSGADGGVAYEIAFATPQKWAGLVRDWDNYYTVTRFYNLSGQLINTFENYASTPGSWSKTFFGYLVESDDPSHWISRIECDGKLSDASTREVGFSDDLYYGTADVQESPPLKVTSATVTFDATKGDQFTMKGLLRNVSLTDVETVLFEAGMVSEEIPLQKFAQVEQIYTYTGSRGKSGRLTLKIDLGAGAFTVTGKNLILSGFTNPLPVKFEVGSFKECGMVHFRVVGNKWSFSSKVDPQYPCVFEQAPMADPDGVFVKTSSKIRIQIAVNSNSALDQGSLKLYRLNENLKTSGKAICSLSDDGKASHGDAASGDGFYSCIASFKENAAGELRLAVKAKVGSKTVVSPSVTIDAVVKLTEKQIDKTLTANKQALKIWKNKRAQFGDTPEACARALPGIRKVDGVKSAQLSANGDSIWITFQSGIKGGLALSMLPPPKPTAESPSLERAVTGNLPDTPDPKPPGHAGGGEPGTGQALRQGASGKCPLDNCSALVYAPYVFEFGEGDAGGRAHYYLTERAAANGLYFNPIRFCEDKDERDNNCPLSMLDNMTSYGTVIFSTHGLVNADGNPMIYTHEPVTSKDIFSSNKKKILLSRPKGKLYIVNCGWWKQRGDKIDDHEDDMCYAFGPDYVSKLSGTFNKYSIIYAGACYSMANEALAKAFIGKGAGAYFGFDTKTFTWHDRAMVGDLPKGPGLFAGLIEDGQTTGEAFASIPDESPPGDGYGKHFKGTVTGEAFDTHFLKASDSNDNIAYKCPKHFQYKYLGASLSTHCDELWIYDDNHTWLNEDVLCAAGHYAPEGRWTSYNTLEVDIRDYDDGNIAAADRLGETKSNFTGRLAITLDIDPASNEIKGTKVMVYAMIHEMVGDDGKDVWQDVWAAGNLPPLTESAHKLVLKVTGSDIQEKYNIRYDWKYLSTGWKNVLVIPHKFYWGDSSELEIEISKIGRSP